MESPEDTERTADENSLIDAIDHAVPGGSLPSSNTSPSPIASSFAVLSPTIGDPPSYSTYHLGSSAFALWREAMEMGLQYETQALHNHVLELQKEFDDASHYIRGDFAWRKQVAAFHERANDLIDRSIETLTNRVQQSTESLATSLEETLKTKDVLAKQEMDRQVQIYEDKLRRTRTSLKKEINRFTHLEKCLRKEETYQAKAMYERLVQQLTLEFQAKEATLHALLREQKLSYLAIENANTQLMETVKNRGEEIERLKKMLPKPGATAGPVRARPGSGAASAGVTASIITSEAHLQSLKQALAAANSKIESFRKHVDELATEKESAAKRQRHAEDAIGQANDELSKVKHLLSESHDALLNNRKDMEKLALERTHWKDLFVDLQFHTSSHEQARDDAVRLVAAAEQRIQSLESQLTKTTTPYALEARLRLEFEKKYSEMLNLRISHERKRVLARVEMLWYKQRSGADAADKKVSSRKAAGETRGEGQATLRQVLQLVSDAFSDLGFTDWSTMDIEKLQHEISRLEEVVSHQRRSLEDLQGVVNDQALRLANADLQQREKELLLRELTDRYRTLKTQHETIKKQLEDSDALLNTMDLAAFDKSDPFTVYGVPQPIEMKKPSASRPRPVSASATLSHSVKSIQKLDRATESTFFDHGAEASTRTAMSRLPMSRRRSDGRESPAPKSFLLNELPLVETQTSSINKTLQEQEDHVRSVLKADLLRLTPTENQLEDGCHVGTDGILQIMQRRRHNRK